MSLRLDFSRLSEARKGREALGLWSRVSEQGSIHHVSGCRIPPKTRSEDFLWAGVKSVSPTENCSIHTHTHTPPTFFLLLHLPHILDMTAISGSPATLLGWMTHLGRGDLCVSLCFPDRGHVCLKEKTLASSPEIA